MCLVYPPMCMTLSVAKILWVICEQHHSLSKNKETAANCDGPTIGGCCVFYSFMMMMVAHSRNTKHVPRPNACAAMSRTAFFFWGPLWNSGRAICVTLGIDIARLTIYFPFLSCFFGSPQQLNKNNQRAPITFLWLILLFHFEVYVNQFIRNAFRSIYANNPVIITYSIAPRSTSANFNPIQLSRWMKYMNNSIGLVTGHQYMFSCIHLFEHWVLFYLIRSSPHSRSYVRPCEYGAANTIRSFAC